MTLFMTEPRWESIIFNNYYYRYQASTRILSYIKNPHGDQIL